MNVLPVSAPWICRMRRRCALLLAALAALTSFSTAFAETLRQGVLRQDQVWESSGNPHRLSENVTVGEGVVVTVAPGAVVTFDKGARLDVEGAFLAAEAVFDGLVDMHNGERIRFLPGSRGRLTRCIVRNLELEIRTNDAAVTESAISNRNGSGISVGKACRPTIMHNDFHGNSYYAVYREGASPLAAPQNFWGAADGPSGAGPGQGDAINPPIDYMPFARADIGEHLILLERRVEPGPVVPGGRLTLVYGIANLNSFDHEAILGASLYRDPANHLHSAVHDRSVVIEPGYHRYIRHFDLPIDLEAGRYTVLWGVMKIDLTAYYALAKDPEGLQVAFVADRDTATDPLSAAYGAGPLPMNGIHPAHAAEDKR